MESGYQRRFWPPPGRRPPKCGRCGSSPPPDVSRKRIWSSGCVQKGRGPRSGRGRRPSDWMSGAESAGRPGNCAAADRGPVHVSQGLRSEPGSGRSFMKNGHAPGILGRGPDGLSRIRTRQFCDFLPGARLGPEPLTDKDTKRAVDALLRRGHSWKDVQSGIRHCAPACRRDRRPGGLVWPKIGFISLGCAKNQVDCRADDVPRLRAGWT